MNPEKLEIHRDEKKINPNDLMREMDKVIQYGNMEDVLVLIDTKKIDVDQTDFEGRTALQMYSFKGNLDAVSELLKRGANINKVFLYQNRVPMTALDAATEANKTDVIKVLKLNGAKSGREISES